jgi:hypothetical protein
MILNRLGREKKAGSRKRIKSDINAASAHAIHI